MTDEKLAVLDHVPYIDKYVLQAAGINREILPLRNNRPLGESMLVFDDKAIQNLRAVGDKNVQGAYISGNEWADIIEGIINDPELSKLEIIGSQQLETSDHRRYNLNIAYEDPQTNQCIISYKGTSGKNEWEDNVHGLVESDTQSQTEALAFFDKYASKEKYKDVIVTGHSKGANKAMYSTIVSENANKISKCVAFDGQGFSNYFIDKYADKIDDNGSKITNYFAKNDFVNVLMKQVENSKQIPCEQYGISSPGEFHSPNSIFMRDEKGRIPVDENNNKVFSFKQLNQKNENMELIRDFISYTMDHADKKELQRISDYIAPLAGEAIGVENPSKLKVGLNAIKDPGAVLKFRKIMSDFAKENNVSKAQFDAVLDQFKVDEKGAQTIDKAKNIVHGVDFIATPFVQMTPYEKADNRPAREKAKVKNDEQPTRSTKLGERNAASTSKQAGEISNKNESGYRTTPMGSGDKVSGNSYSDIQSISNDKEKQKNDSIINVQAQKKKMVQ